MEPADYLDRLGVEAPEEPSLAAVGRLQEAHVGTVPFENLAVVGDPFRDGADARWAATGVDLSLPALYEKVVERERGGFCFELNGLFTWLLRELGVDERSSSASQTASDGVDADRLAARMVGEDGTGRPPANHHSIAVAFDRRYLVDVGMGTPPMRRPLPLDGEVVTDHTGVSWRVVESERPDEQYLTQYRLPGEAWQDRYLVSDVPRDISYFQATCDYLASAPESTFTGDPVVSIGTESGYRKLNRETLTRWDGENGEELERTVEPDEWVDLLEERFGLRY